MLPLFMVKLDMSLVVWFVPGYSKLEVIRYDDRNVFSLVFDSLILTNSHPIPFHASSLLLVPRL